MGIFTRERVLEGFIAAFYYGLLPASAIFSVVCGWALSTYSFKASLFLLTGSVSIRGLPLPEALPASLGECAVGALMTAGSGAILLLYEWAKRKKAPKKPQLPMTQEYPLADLDFITDNESE